MKHVSAEMQCQVCITSLAGVLGTVAMTCGSSVAALKAAVTAATNIPSAEQRLFLRSKELLNREVLGADFAPGATIGVHMVRRSPGLARILEDIVYQDDVRAFLREAGDEAH